MLFLLAGLSVGQPPIFTLLQRSNFRFCVCSFSLSLFSFFLSFCYSCGPTFSLLRFGFCTCTCSLQSRMASEMTVNGVGRCAMIGRCVVCCRSKVVRSAVIQSADRRRSRARRAETYSRLSTGVIDLANVVGRPAGLSISFARDGSRRCPVAATAV